MCKPRFNPNKFLSLFFIGSLLMAENAAAVDVSGNDKFGSIGFAAYQGIIDKSTTVKELVPDMVVKVDFGKKSQAIIEFCAEGNMFNTRDGSRADHGSVQVSALVDGTQVGDRIQYFTYENFGSLPHCYMWVTPPMSGVHKVSIDWELVGAGITGRFHDRILKVHYK